MGDVYRAHDTRLARDVALKVLPAEMSASSERLERFQREAKALAALDHPGIVGVYSVEESEGFHFLTMQLVEGEPLDRLIPRDGLPCARLLSIATSLTDALSAAHEKGIVHRDLKPANVMLTADGHVKVLDFGLAKMTVPNGNAGVDSATDMRTQAGVVMGTLPYMSPEQVQGLAVDHRSDIFSLGVILYELATGQRPFQGRSTAELASVILRDDAKSLSEIRPDLPKPFALLVERCLRKSVADRFASAREVRAALNAIPLTSSADVEAVGDRRIGRRRITLVAAIALIAIVAVVTWRVQRRESSPQMQQASEMTLAVLPIENLGKDSSLEYLADGMTGELAGALKRVPGLQVSGDLSTFRFKGAHVDPAEIARQLGVRMLLTGRLQPGVDRVRLQMQLSNPDGRLLWSNTYDRQRRDTFAMQDEITAAVASELRLVLSPKTVAGTRAGRTINAEAHDLFLRGQFEKNKLSPEGLARALGYFQRALALDPHYAQAHAGVAFVYDMQADVYAPSHEYHSLALAAARRALESDDQLPEAHALVGYEMIAANWDFPGGKAEMARGLALNPNSSDALFMAGIFAWVTGDEAQAVSIADRLLKIDPLSALAARLRAEALQWGGRNEEALRQHQIANSLDPTVILTEATDANALRDLGRYDESIQSFLNYEKTFNQPSWGLAVTYGRMGRHEDALRAIHAVEARERKQWVDPDFIAIAYAANGDRDNAMRWLNKAWEVKSWCLRAFLNVDSPWLRELHSDPRYIELRKRVLSTRWSS